MKLPHFYMLLSIFTNLTRFDCNCKYCMGSGARYIHGSSSDNTCICEFRKVLLTHTHTHIYTINIVHCYYIVITHDFYCRGTLCGPNRRHCSPRIRSSLLQILQCPAFPLLPIEYFDPSQADLGLLHCKFLSMSRVRGIYILITNY